MNNNTTSKTEKIMLSKIKYLKKIVENSKKEFFSHEIRNKGLSFFLKTTVTLFTVAITVIVGINNQILSPKINIIILILSGFVIIFNTWDSFFNPQKRWLAYTDTWTKLNNLSITINYLELDANSVKDEDIDNLLKEYKNILSNYFNRWTELIGKQEEAQKVRSISISTQNIKQKVDDK